MIWRAIKQNSEVLTFPQLMLSLLLRLLLCCIRRIRLCASFSVKKKKTADCTYIQSNFQLLDILGAKRQFPFKAPAVNLAASASIKAIIMGHVTKAQKNVPWGKPKKKKKKEKDPWGSQTSLLYMFLDFFVLIGLLTACRTSLHVAEYIVVKHSWITAH